MYTLYVDTSSRSLVRTYIYNTCAQCTHAQQIIPVYVVYHHHYLSFKKYKSITFVHIIHIRILCVINIVKEGKQFEIIKTIGFFRSPEETLMERIGEEADKRSVERRRRQ